MSGATIRTMDKAAVQTLLYGSSAGSNRVAYFMLSLDAFLFSLLIVQAVYPDSLWILAVEFVFGLVYLTEYLIRWWAAPDRRSFTFDFFNITDLLVIASLVAPALIGNLALLRILRSLRILRAYRTLTRLSRTSRRVSQSRDVAFAALNLLAFVFIMTTIVYIEEVNTNPDINTTIDAFYFSVASLTTTGYGDIVPATASGRILSVLIMLFGVTLFIRLASSVVRPNKVRIECPRCGLNRHDADAVHCKHCGRVMHITTPGGA